MPWVDLLTSFLAILFAAGIVARYNHWFLKSERWHQTADSFCVNLEKMVIDYFSARVSAGERSAMTMQYYGYLDAFICFVGDSKKLDNDKMNAQYYDLWDLDDVNIPDHAKIMRALRAIALIRSILTK